MKTRRPDLELLPFTAPTGIAEILLPKSYQPTMTNILNYMPLTAYSAGQTNRTPGSAPNATLTGESVRTTLVVETVFRGKLPYGQKAGLELENWQASMSRAGKCANLANTERRGAVAIFGAAAGSPNYSLFQIKSAAVGTSVIEAIEAARDHIENQSVTGKVVVFGAKQTINWLKKQAEIKEKMLYTGIGSLTDARSIRSISNEQLANVLDVDMVLSGNNTAWLGNASAYAGYLGVCLVPDGAPEEIPTLGATVWKLNGETEAGADSTASTQAVYTWDDDDTDSHIVDVQAYTQSLITNPQLAYIITGLSGSLES